MQKSIAKFLKKKLNKKQILILRTIRDTYRAYFDPYPYRKYLTKHKVIFIHIPKTAGTSVITSLGGVPGDHCTYREFLQASPARFERFFKFCFVRNPYDRLVSAYEYLKQGGNQDTDLAIQKIILDKYDTFEKFVCDFLDKDMIYRINVLKPQYWFIYDEHNNLMVDYVARFESIESEYRKLMELLKIKTSLPVKNRSAKRKRDYKSYYNDSIKNIVNSLYILDFDLLEY